LPRLHIIPTAAIATANHPFLVGFSIKNSFSNGGNRDFNGKSTAAIGNYQP